MYTDLNSLTWNTFIKYSKYSCYLDNLLLFYSVVLVMDFEFQ